MVLFRYIDEHQDLYVQRLREAVAIQSVSAWPEKRGEIVKMVKHVAEVSTFTAVIQIQLL